MSKPSSAYRGLQSCRDMLSNQFTPKYGENFDGYLDAMRDALDWMRWAERKIEHLEALSHAAGQDGEQCRAASENADFAKMDAVYNFLMGISDLGGVSFGERHPMVRGQFWWRHDLAAAYASIRALSRGVPEEDDSLPVPLRPVSKEWYRLCERRFAVDRITISGKLAEAIVDAVCGPAIAAQRKEGE